MSTSPTATQPNASTTPPPKRNTTIFWVLFLVCALPYLLGWIWLQTREHLPVVETSNHGDLISPVRSIADLSLVDMDGNVLADEALRGKWLLLSVANSACGEICQRNMYFMRQVRRAMSTDRNRVVRVLVLSDTQDLEGFRQKLTDYEGMYVVTGAETSVTALQERLKAPNPVAENGIYMIDPMGNFMLSYPPEFDPQLIIKDLRRILDISQVG